MSNIRAIRFAARWSGPCKSLARSLEGHIFPIELEVIDIDDNRSMAEKYSVRGVPCVMILKDGKEVARKMGAIPPRLIEEMISEHV